jgi:Domain of unknown function (DUF4340)
MTFRKEYIIAAAIIAASLVYLIVRNDSKVNYEIPRFADVKTEEISSVIFSGGGKSLELKKTGNLWTIEPQGFRADESQVNRLLSEAVQLSIVDLISTRDDYARYELDEKAVSVTISTEDGPRKVFRFGKSSSSAIYSYITMDGQEGIYSVRGNLKNVFSLSLDKWRDKQVMNFDPETAAAIEINKEGEVVTLIKTTVTDTPGWSFDGQVLENSDEIQNHMKSLGMLKSTGFINEATGEPIVSMKVTSAEGVHTLQIYEKLDNGYSARSSYVEDPFLIPFYLGDIVIDLV